MIDEFVASGSCSRVTRLAQFVSMTSGVAGFLSHECTGKIIFAFLRLALVFAKPSRIQRNSRGPLLEMIAGGIIRR